jgi:hypothetical protein
VLTREQSVEGMWVVGERRRGARGDLCVRLSDLRRFRRLLEHGARLPLHSTRRHSGHRGVDQASRIATDLVPSIETLPAAIAPVLLIVAPLMVVHPYRSRHESESAPLQLVPGRYAQGRSSFIFSSERQGRSPALQ